MKKENIRKLLIKVSQSLLVLSPVLAFGFPCAFFVGEAKLPKKYLI